MQYKDLNHQKLFYLKFKLKALISKLIIIFFVTRSFNLITTKFTAMKLTSLFILTMMFSTIAIAQNIDYRNIPQIQTTATSSQEVYADKITLSITLSESDTKGKVSVETLEQRLKKVLLANTIDLDKQLTLANMASNFKDYFLKKTDVQKVKNYQLEVYDASTAGNILKGLESQNISNVSLLKTEYSKLEELKIELKVKAVKKAKQQAEVMLNGLGQELGPAIYISDSNIKSYGMLNESIMTTKSSVMYNSKAEKSLDVEFDKIKVEAEVRVYFKLN